MPRRFRFIVLGALTFALDVGGTVVQVDAGGNNTCARLDTDTVRCWGVGGAGALGYANVDDIGDDETPASAADVSVR